MRRNRTKARRGRRRKNRLNENIIFTRFSPVEWSALSHNILMIWILPQWIRWDRELFCLSPSFCLLSAVFSSFFFPTRWKWKHWLSISKHYLAQFYIPPKAETDWKFAWELTQRALFQLFVSRFSVMRNSTEKNIIVWSGNKRSSSIHHRRSCVLSYSLQFCWCE